MGIKFTLPAYPGCDMFPVTDPVVLTDGKLYVPYTDVEIPGPGRFNHVNLKFQRSYNSRDNFSGVLGWGWVTNLDINLSFSGGVASLKDWDGSRYFMQYSTSITIAGGGAPRAGFEHGPWTLEQVSSPSAAFILTKTFGTRYVFSATAPYYLLRIEDRQGHTITYNRDTSGKVTSLVDSASQTLSFTYHTSGRLATVTDPLSRVWEYTPSGDNLDSVEDPLAHTTYYEYNDTDIHNLTVITDTHGRTTYYTYNSSDRVTQLTNPDSTTKSFGYDTANNESTMEDEAGQTHTWKWATPGIVTEVTLPQVGTQVRKWQYEYNDQKKMTLMRDPKNRVMQWEWDARHNLKKVIPREAGTTWEIETDAAHHFPGKVTDPNSDAQNIPTYDSLWNVTNVEDALGNDTTYTYYPSTSSAYGLVNTVTDRNGKTSTLTWDSKGNLLTITDATSRTVTFTYDAAGRRLTAAISGAPTMEWSYDAADRLTQVKRGSSVIQTVAYVENPQKVTITDAASMVTEYTFDSGGRVYEVGQTGYTAKTKYQYTARGQLWKVTDTAGRVTEREYDAGGRLIKFYQPDPAGGSARLVTEYGYDSDDTLVSLKDPAGETTEFAWDPSTRTKTTTFPDSTTEIEEYDTRGRMICFTNRAGDEREKTYNKLDWLISQACPTCGASFKYDNEGRLIFVDDATAGDGVAPTGSDITHYDFAFEYDDAGRLLKEKQPGPGDTPRAVTIEHTYDSAGRPSTLKWPDATTATYTYDSAGRLDSLARSAGSGTWYFDYLDNDLPAYRTLPNGITGEYYYDGAMRLSSLYWWDSNYSALLVDHYYEWNTANEITLHWQGNGKEGLRDYTHDGISRLKTSTPDAGTGTLFAGDLPRTWNYDEAGNRTSVVTGTGGGATTVSYTLKSGEWNLYDTVGAATMQYDANKNLESDGVLDMEYDADNRLTDLDKSGVFTQDLVYDWMGRLIKKTVTPNGGSATTTRYYYTGWTVLAEVNESGGATLHRYIPGPGIDNLLADETGGTTYYPLQDLLGSTSALATNGTTVAQRYTYDPYGTPTVRDAAGDPTSAAPITNYLYTGREYDQLSGLYNYRHRFYHPGLGRFLQPDPIGFEGGLHFQNYVASNPMAQRDPLGLDNTPWPGNGSVTNNYSKPVYVLVDGDYYRLDPGCSTPNGITTAWDVDGLWCEGRFYSVSREVLRKGENCVVHPLGNVSGRGFFKTEWNKVSGDPDSPTSRGSKHGDGDPAFCNPPLLPQPKLTPSPPPPAGAPKPPTS